MESVKHGAKLTIIKCYNTTQGTIVTVNDSKDT